MDWIAVVSCLTAWLLFANTWNGDFVYDDSRAIVNNEDLRQTTPWLQLWRNDFWGTPLNHAGSHQSWRPFCVLSFRFNFYFSGLNAKSYHLVNAAMHSIATLCLALLMRPLLMKKKKKKREWICRLAAALAFAAHPIHCEAVASVVGRAELGHTLHTLLALLAYRNHLIARKEEEEKVEHSLSSTSTNGSSSSSSSGGGLLLVVQQLMHRVVSTICCCCSSPSSSPSKTKTETLLDASSSSSSSVRGRHYEHLPPTSSSSSSSPWMGQAKSMLYLTSSCCLAWTAILWKENGIMALPLCAIMELMASVITCSSSSSSSTSTSTSTSGSGIVVQWKNLALVGLLSASQVTVRLLMLDGGGRGGPWFAAADNPVARDSSFLTRTCTFFYLPVYNALLLLWPSALSFDWSMDTIAPVQSLTDPRNVASITFYATLIALGLRAFGRRHKNPLLILALGLLILPFIPASNLFFYVGFVVAERVLYLPSAGYCLLLAVGLDRLLHHTHRRRRRWIQVSLLITVFFWSLRTARRNADWTSEERLYRSAIGINPAKAYGNMAAILARDGHRQVEAEYAYRQALTYRPNMAESHFNLALLLQTQGRYQEASSSYLQAIRYRPNLAAAHLNLGQLLGKQGRYDEAIHWLAACTQLDSSASVRDPSSHRHSQIQALILWGQMELAVRQQPARAVQLYKQALRRSPTNPQQLEAVYEALGEAYQLQGDVHESERWLRKAVDVDHAPAGQEQSSAALLTYARFLAKNASRHDEAEQLFRQAQRIAPHDPVVYMLTGQFLLDVSRKREAADAFVQAAFLAPDDFEAVFNAAATLREVKDLQRAEHYYRRAVQLRPDDVVVYRNLGALLHLQGRWNEAEDNYKLALHLSPDDKTTLINMQRLHHAIDSQRQKQQQQQRNDSH